MDTRPRHTRYLRRQDKAQTRNVIVIAEAVAGRMIVEAVGRKGANVRLTVKRESLREPQPDLFG
jgi:hypothetical protein